MGFTVQNIDELVSSLLQVWQNGGVLNCEGSGGSETNKISLYITEDWLNLSQLPNAIPKPCE